MKLSAAGVCGDSGIVIGMTDKSIHVFDFSGKPIRTFSVARPVMYVYDMELKDEIVILPNRSETYYGYSTDGKLLGEGERRAYEEKRQESGSAFAGNSAGGEIPELIMSTAFFVTKYFYLQTEWKYSYMSGKSANLSFYLQYISFWYCALLR